MRVVSCMNVPPDDTLLFRMSFVSILIQIVFDTTSNFSNLVCNNYVTQQNVTFERHSDFCFAMSFLILVILASSLSLELDTSFVIEALF